MSVRILRGDCREVFKTMEDESVHCVVTSPPYWGLRDYGVMGQIGMEDDVADYVSELVGVFRSVKRVLRRDGTVWLNLGDSYLGGGRGGGGPTNKQQTNVGSLTSVPNARINGLKAKDLAGIPWRVAFALQADGWYLRQDIIWSKPNPMPESARDRCTKAHEYIFLLSKREQYYYDQDAIAEMASADNREFFRGNDKHTGGNAFNNSRNRSAEGAGHVPNATGRRNKRSVWEITTQPFPEAHFATFPPALIEPCIKAGCPAWGTVLDPFGGAGTTGLVADRLGRNAILIELNPKYAEMAERRIRGDAPLFADVGAA